MKNCVHKIQVLQDYIQYRRKRIYISEDITPKEDGSIPILINKIKD